MTESDRKEADVKRVCDDLAVRINWHAESYEQDRASHICRGLPDRRYVQRNRMQRVWIEFKRPGGQLTESQHRWMLDELYAGGFATVIDDQAQLVKLFNLFAMPRVGRDEMVRNYCLELLRLTAQRGWRKEAA